MIVPKKIIFWIAVLLPFSVLLPHLENMGGLFAGAVFAGICIAVTDAVLGLKRAGMISICIPDLIHLHFRRDCSIKFRICNPEKIEAALLFNPMLPPELSYAPNSLAVSVPPLEFSEFPFACKPSRRGSFKLESCLMELESPLKLWSVRKRVSLSSEVRVYPDIQKDGRTFAALCLNKGFQGIHVQPLLGQGREFEKLRDYMPGDGYEIVAWKATAKKGRPISKIFQMERTQKIYVVIDISRLGGKKNRAGLSSLEHYLNAALLMGIAAEKQGDMFGIMAFDDQVRKFIRASNGKSHYMRCRDSIYSLCSETKSPGFENLFSFIRLHIRSRAILFFLTDLGEPGIAESFISDMKIVNRQHLCLVNTIKDESFGPIFETAPVAGMNELHSKLAGHICWSQLMGVRRELGRFGVHFSMSDIDSFNTDLISDYINVKKRQIA